MASRMPHGSTTSFTIEPCSVSTGSRKSGVVFLKSHPSSTGLVVAPIKIVKNCDLPLSYCCFDAPSPLVKSSTPLMTAFNSGTVYFHYRPRPNLQVEQYDETDEGEGSPHIILDSGLLRGSFYCTDHVVLVKVNDDPKRLSFIQNINGDLWMLCRLKSSIRVKDIRFIDTVSYTLNSAIDDDVNLACADSIKSRMLDIWKLDPPAPVTTHSNVWSDLILDLTPPSHSTSLNENTEISKCLPSKSFASETESIENIGLHAVAQRLKSNYLESLYLTQTPLSYFAKNTLSKIRNLVKTHNMADYADLNCKPNDDNSDDAKRLRDKNRQRKKNYKLLLHNLSSLIVDVPTLDEKYKSDPNLLSLLADPSSPSNTEITTGSFTTEEFNYFKQWYTKTNELQGGLITNQKFTKFLSELKIREIQLQIILLLEILVNDYRNPRGGSPMITYMNTFQETISSETNINSPSMLFPSSLIVRKTDNQPMEVSVTARLMRPRARKLKPKLKKPTVVTVSGTVPKHPANEISTVHSASSIVKPLSRLHQLSPDTLIDIFFDRLCIWQAINTSTPSSSSNNKAKSSFTIASPNTGDQKDELLEFCLEVIMPYYGSKLPRKTRNMLKKANGKTVITPSTTFIKEKEKEKDKEVTITTVPNSPSGSISMGNISGNALPTFMHDNNVEAPNVFNTQDLTALQEASTLVATAKPIRTPTVAKKMPSLRGGLPTLTHRGLQRRQVEISFKSSSKSSNTVTTSQNEGKLDASDAVKEELLRAIRTISKPSRSIVAEETAAFHQTRLSRSTAANSSHKVVQVAQTPAKGKKRVFNIDAHSATSQISAQTHIRTPSKQRSHMYTPSKSQSFPQIIMATPLPPSLSPAYFTTSDFQPRTELERIISSPLRHETTPRKRRINNDRNGVFDIDVITGTPIRKTPLNISAGPLSSNQIHMHPTTNRNSNINSPMLSPARRRILSTPQKHKSHGGEMIIPGTETRNTTSTVTTTLAVPVSVASKLTSDCTPSKRRRQTMTPLQPSDEPRYFTDDDNELAFGIVGDHNDSDDDGSDFDDIFTNSGPLKGRRLFNLGKKSVSSSNVDL
ncbi:hypothetical protein NADFUDRAFT_76929 [Nadsonia fulvescens var. elongata DSM 6958]|uniref:DNA replication regulator Sld3 C-terminal domain-containing protein n=1 Tax=Nadsonia fulvescens var. elongata DSM 6958 TaxID=857566 RepID=A0A1E3PTQ2_9ASCO|nr:hypothetical protein NADFUDRAFT_76929 [Nadsonia fulvescens var. elongata DSM 6958]